MTKNRKLNLKEFDQLQKLKHENKILKKELSLLRKQIKQLDFDSDRYFHLQDLARQQYEEEKRTSKASKLRKKWKCFQCGKGTLKLVIVPRSDGEYYFRKCNCCEHRTKLKKYTEDVEGVK